MNRDLLNFSADLRRVAYWIYSGNTKLANKTLSSCRERYTSIKKIGCFHNVWDEINNISVLKWGREKSAEKALTISVIAYNKGTQIN